MASEQQPVSRRSALLGARAPRGCGPTNIAIPDSIRRRQASRPANGRALSNLAMVLVTAGSGLLVQFAFWALYHSPLTGLQWAGIALTVAGSILASWSGSTPEPAPVTGQSTKTEAA